MFPAITLTGTKEAVEYYLKLRDEVKDLVDRKQGVIAEEKYRLLWDMIPIWYDLGLFSYLEERGALVVCDIYARTFSGRMDNIDPFLALADRYVGMPYLRAGLKGRTIIFKELIQEYQVDGAIFASNRTCRLVSIGQLDMIRSLGEDLGIPIATFQTDMTDPRMYNREEVLDILDSFLDILESRGGGHGTP
jgi:benzoyl-CoA reductase/2-hydroxyglutaryl-CoA dehydratase subunit BcrC/BadD/HgdB